MTKDEILNLIDRPIVGAAIGAALELGLFWQLARGPEGADAIGEGLGIPRGRCEAWLRVLADAGLVEESSAGFRLTQEANSAIVETYSRETWRMLAEEARERLAAVGDLPASLRSASAKPEGGVAAYVAAMSVDSDRARRFTRMLYELHQDLAAQVASSLDLAGVRRLIDLGGGSGVVAMALTGRWPGLSVTVLDVPNVCDVGRELVAAAQLGDRIDFRPIDFLHDELPSGFDAVLECDVRIYSEPLFRRIHDVLTPGARLIIVDELASGAGSDPSRAAWMLTHTLEDPDWIAPTVASTRDLMERAGFVGVTESRLGTGPGVGGRKAAPVVLVGTIPPD